MQLKILTNKLRALRRKQEKKKKAEQSAAISEAWGRRQFSEVHILARAAAGNGAGARKRDFMMSKLCQPTVEEWRSHLSQVGGQGGMMMFDHAWEDMYSEHLECAKETPLPLMSGSALSEASADQDMLRFHLRKA